MTFEQDQFLSVVDRDEAERRFQQVLNLAPLDAEEVELSGALGRILARDIRAAVDVPAFDRSNVDGYAVRAADTFGASEERPRSLRINPETLSTGVLPALEVHCGTATVVATGAIVPRGADAVVMVEYTHPDASGIKVFRPVVPGSHITFAGSDVARGETVLRSGQTLSSRETGVLAAIGLGTVPVIRRPRVAVISTGDEIVPPGAMLPPGHVYDSNMTILCDAIRELGGQPLALGVVGDDEPQLMELLERALEFDMVLLSGGTSKGTGDISYRAVSALPPASAGTPPAPLPSAVLAHGVALKPGKPICLAATQRSSDHRNIPVVVLPGFPTSAIFTFHEFVAPVIRAWAGRRQKQAPTTAARLPIRINSERGRTEFLLVRLVHGPKGLAAYPMGKGSGSVTAFSQADGFITIPRDQELVERDSITQVQLLGGSIEPPDFIAIGSHCVGLDLLLGCMHARGLTVKSMAVGSTAGLEAARRGECHVAGVHLIDPATGSYNRAFLGTGLVLIQGYARMQGFVFRPNDPRFQGKQLEAALDQAVTTGACRMVNRNRGSGTRVLIDRLLMKFSVQPAGYFAEVRSHHAVAAAVAQRRADWGVAIESVALHAGLAFLPICQEEFDFLIPAHLLPEESVRTFLDVLTSPGLRAQLIEQKLIPKPAMGERC